MKFLHPVAFVPNDLITDTTIHYTTKRVAVVLLHLSGRKGRPVKVTFRELAKLARCSTATAQQAISELLEGGYIIKRKSYRYSTERGHLIYDANSYLWMRRNGGYTMIRKELLAYDVSPAAFCNLLYLYCCAGSTGRAFPSLRRIAGRLKAGTVIGLDMAKSTVCVALSALRIAQAVVRHLCTTLRRCHAANSYYLTDMVGTGGGATRPLVEGGPKIDTPNIITQLTGAFTKREEKYGVAQFGNLHNFNTLFSDWQPYWFDGNGVRVSPGNEQELLA